MGKARNSSIELLRIISMLFIVCSHFCVHGGFHAENMSFSVNKLILQNGSLGNLGVVIFVMISGYFLSQSSFKLSRIVKIVLQVFFYSCTIYFVFAALKIIPFSIFGTISEILPISFSQYWFATTYVVFCIFTPYINRMLNNFSRKQYIVFLSVLLLVWSILPMLTNYNLGSNELCQFLIFYSLGAFARRYPNISILKKNRYWIAFISAFLLILSNLILNLFPILNIYELDNYFYHRHSILVIALSYGLLLIFTNINIKPNKIINTISSTTFGIYLIHDNNHLRGIIWHDILRVSEYKYKPTLILYLIVCVIGVFIICAIIDYLRQKLIEKPVMRVLEPFINRITDKAKYTIGRIHID